MIENRTQAVRIHSLIPRETFNGPEAFPVAGPEARRPQPDHHVVVRVVSAEAVPTIGLTACAKACGALHLLHLLVSALE